ncbi:dethiobiotin synthase [Paenibacillus alkalitolerans]|uniref:dethiobiotin synthase n=1 Tax=Paenibacillus alkalitolerans TaxID=2799335 RepID=UPI0018F7729F|nr:dethiobiotin synthase [Paenibacillus alkalitolerans]
MRNGLFVTGTDTEVGKTVVASVLAAAIARKLETETAGTVALWKPVQTGVEPGAADADSTRLVNGSGLPIAESETASHTFPDPVAPWMAAQRSGGRIVFNSLVDEGRSRMNACDFLMVEGAGGLAVPLTDRHLMSDLAAELKLPLLIVARPGLGTVNHTLLTAAYARSAGMDIAGVILNGYRDGQAAAMEENAMMIERFGNVPVVGKLPWIPGEPSSPGEWADWRSRWLDIVEQDVDLSALV